jgi:hypothetical protein
MDDFTTSERIEESWAKSWDKSADALTKAAETWAKAGSGQDYQQAAKCQILAECYRGVATTMRMPRLRRIEVENGEAAD